MCRYYILGLMRTSIVKKDAQCVFLVEEEQAAKDSSSL
jgi:hypothetical protein